MRTELSPTEFIEDMLCRLANSWLARNADQAGVSDDEAIAKFSNLSVSALYQLMEANLYPYLLQTPVTRKMVRKSLRSYNYTQAEQDLVDDVIPPKTSVKKWLKQKRDEGVEISARLYNVLLSNIRLLEYVEYITKDEFCMFRNVGESTWREFVELRGY